MKSVGEAMAIGRTFKASLQKCLRYLEFGLSGLGADGSGQLATGVSCAWCQWESASITNIEVKGAWVSCQPRCLGFGEESRDANES